MPLVTSEYTSRGFFKNGHFSTIYSGLFRKVSDITQERERIRLPDGDFLDLDWSYAKTTSDKLIIILHGLEGNGQRPYMIGTAKLFNRNNNDAVCVNFRGCSGENNALYKSYHSGATEDLIAVIDHILQYRNYKEIVLNGFSLGGNIVLKYLGEGHVIPSQIKTAIAVSVPCYLQGSAIELHTFKNILYHNRFRKHLVDKLKLKHEKFPEIVTKEAIKSIRTLTDFDNIYTSKAHSFKNAQEYYEKSSSLQFLPNINVPTLIINALNDSFLSPECFPIKEAKLNPHLFLEMPKHGGHVGFFKKGGFYYNELRALDFSKKRA